MATRDAGRRGPLSTAFGLPDAKEKETNMEK
jgi:hypothetical protein